MPGYVDSSYFKELLDSSPAIVKNKENCIYHAEPKSYQVTIWDTDYLIDPAQETIRTLNVSAEPPHEYFEVFIIYYLMHVKNCSLTGEWISEKDLPGGATFFRGPHLLPTQTICEAIGDDIERLHRRALSLSGTPLQMADLAFQFQVTPEIQLAVLYWQADEDFGAEARLLFDSSIGKILPLDVIFALGTQVCYMLSRE